MALNKLPTGITNTFTSSGRCQFNARFTLDGLRINLGTFDSLAKAINAMCDFKVRDIETNRQAWLGLQAVMYDRHAVTLSNIAKTSLADVASELTVQAAKADAAHLELLADVDPSSLSFDSGVTLQGVTIPQTTVVAFLNKLYGLTS